MVCRFLIHFKGIFFMWNGYLKLWILFHVPYFFMNQLRVLLLFPVHTKSKHRVLWIVVGVVCAYHTITYSCISYHDAWYNSTVCVRVRVLANNFHNLFIILCFSLSSITLHFVFFVKSNQVKFHSFFSSSQKLLKKLLKRKFKCELS